MSKTKQVPFFIVLIVLILAGNLVGGCAIAPSVNRTESPEIEQNVTKVVFETPSIGSTLGTSEASAGPIESTSEMTSATSDVYDFWAGIDPRNQQIIFWHIFSEEREQALAEIVNDFNSSNPYNIQVIIANQGSYVDIFNMMLEVSGTPEAPDLLIAYQNQAAIYQMSDGLIDLTSLIDSPTWGLPESEGQSLFASVLAQDVYPFLASQRLGLPLYRSVDMLYYNIDWLQKLGYTAPPTSPDEFAGMVCAAASNPYITEEANRSTGTIFFTEASRLAAWVFAMGGDIYDPVAQQFTLNGDLVKGALGFQRNLLASNCAMQSLTWDYDQEQFIQGKVMMIMASSNLISYFSGLEESGGLNFHWGAAPYPHLTPDPVSNSYGPSVSITNTSPERELAAFLFLKHLLSSESQTHWAESTGMLPIRSDLDERLEGWFNDYPAYQTAYSLLWNTKSEPALPGYDFIRKEIQDATSAVLEGGDMNAILDALNVKAEEIIANQNGN